MLAIYATPPIDTHRCAIVDPLKNTAVWYHTSTLGSQSGRWNVGWSTYQDGGDHIVYGRSVPRIVERLVEQHTGRRIRIGCN